MIVLRRGEILARHRKMHLFGGLGEDTALTAGESLALLETPLGPAALALCFDIRFPELFRAHVRRAPSLLLIPSQWPHPRIQHWRLLLRARAVENLAYAVGVNAAGSPEINRLHGHSAVVDPWGERLWEAGQEEAVGLVDLHLQRVKECRAKLPALGLARDDLLGPSTK
jgi:predicted amidohydrolase